MNEHAPDGDSEPLVVIVGREHFASDEDYDAWLLEGLVCKPEAPEPAARLDGRTRARVARTFLQGRRARRRSPLCAWGRPPPGG